MNFRAGQSVFEPPIALRDEPSCGGIRQNDTGIGALVLGGAHGALACVRSLGRQGIPAWFVTHDNFIASYSRHATRALRWDGPNRDDAVEQLEGLVQRHGLHGFVLIPCGDSEVRLVAQNHDRLNRVLRLITQPWDILRRVYDKRLLDRLSVDVGVATPSITVGDTPNAAAAIRYPAVIKPATRELTNELTRAKAWKALDKDDFERKYARAVALMGPGEVIVQEMIPGGGEAQFSHASIWRHGKMLAGLAARRRRQFPLEFGFTSTFVETVENRTVEDAACKLLSAVDYHGIAEVEFKFDHRDDTYKVLDVNTRPWTWIGLGQAAGVDFPWLAYRLGAGDLAEPVRSAGHAAWMHPWRDVLVALQLMVKGKLGIGDYAQAYRCKLTLADFAMDDPVPGLLDLPLMLPRLIKRYGQR